LAVIHSEQQGDDRRPVIQNIPFYSSQSSNTDTRLTVVAGYLVASPSRIDERDASVRIMRRAVMFDICRVEPLFGDAVAIKDDTIAVFKGELRRWIGSMRSQARAAVQNGGVR
jgi:hypothetical protein